MGRGVDPLRLVIYVALLAVVGVRVTYRLTDTRSSPDAVPRGTASIAGIVRDDAGAPVPDARVRLWSRDPAIDTTVRTDAAGAFAIQALPAGSYTLAAEKDGYLGDRRNYRQRMRLDIPVRQVTVADSEPSAGVEVPIVRGATIAGAVYDTGGSPAARRYVRILRRDPHFDDVSWIDAAPVAATDDAGRFRVGGLAAGEYVVMAGLTENGERRVYHPDATRISGAAPVAIATGEERAGVDLRARSVETTSVAGVVRGPGGAPIAGVRVDLTSGGGSEPDDRRQSATTAADGTFAFANVQADDYRVNARTEATGWTGVPDGTRAWASALVAARGLAPSRVVLVLEPGRQLTGRVTFPPDAARPAGLRTAPIALSPADAATRALLRSASRLSAPLEADGRFTFAGVPPGTYRVAPRYIDDTWSVSGLLAGTMDLASAPLIVTPRGALPELSVRVSRR